MSSRRTLGAHRVSFMKLERSPPYLLNFGPKLDGPMTDVDVLMVDVAILMIDVVISQSFKSDITFS